MYQNRLRTQEPWAGGEAPLRLEAGKRHTIVLSSPPRVETLLPAAGAGFYTYGPVNHRYGQAHVVAAIAAFAAGWAREHPNWLIGIGDLSLRGGGDTPRHSSHKRGLDVDLRPLRMDGRHEPVTIREAAYSRERTRALAAELSRQLALELIFFNDLRIQGVRRAAGHDNHLHLRFKPV